MRIGPYILGAVAVLAGALLIAVPRYDRPPLVSEDFGPSALELVNLTNPRTVVPYNTVPEPLPVAEDGGPMATDVYKNVQVLKGVSKADFDRLMVAITQWVAPKQGCGFCHVVSKGYADDELYTDKVSRRMLEMTMHVNATWGNHVAPVGVTCATCHRGENIPPRVWYKQPEPEHAGLLGKPRPWQTNAPTIRQFFPTGGNEAWLVNDESVNVEAQAALPGEKGSGVSSEATAEDLYVMMMLWSDALGSNCNLCHSSRAMYDWKQSSPYRLVGLWGQYLTQDINKNFLIPVNSLLPQDQLGQMGDAAKAECGTCHMGQLKPFGGYNVLSHYPVLGPPGGVSAGPDQPVRDITRPIEIQGPAWDPGAKVVSVSIPDFPPPQTTAQAEPAAEPAAEVPAAPAPAPAPAPAGTAP